MIIEENAGNVSCIRLSDFLKYASGRKIKFKEHQVTEILRNEASKNEIGIASFIKLLILASCGGDRSKIAAKNFQKLMDHMDIGMQ